MRSRLCILSPSTHFSRFEKVQKTYKINTISGGMAMAIWKAQVEGFMYLSMQGPKSLEIEISSTQTISD